MIRTATGPVKENTRASVVASVAGTKRKAVGCEDQNTHRYLQHNLEDFDWAKSSSQGAACSSFLGVIVLTSTLSVMLSSLRQAFNEAET